MSAPLDLAQDVVKRALRQGADAAEVYVAGSRSVRVAAAGQYAMPTLHANEGIGIRVARAGRIGAAGAESLAGVDQALADALDAAGRPGASTAIRFTRPRDALHDETFAPDVDDPAGERALDMVEAVIHHVLTRKEVSYAQSELRRWTRDVAIANSEGVALQQLTGGALLEVELRVSRGDAHLTTRDAFVEDLPAFDAPAALDTLVDRAASALAPRPLEGGAVDQVILHPAPASQLLSLLANSFSGASLAGGKSPLPRELGREVFSPLFHLHDDPRGRRVFDDEGTPTRLHPLVAAGRVVGHMHDARSAAAMQVEPTGHAQRRSVLSGVAPRPQRLVMAGGDATLDEIIGSTQRAVLITEPLLGSFASDKVTADFSVVAPFAFYVESGKVRHALPPTTVGGNAHEVFRSLRMVGRETRACAGATVPALLAGGATCAT